MNITKPFIIGMIHLPPTLTYSGWIGMDKFLKKAKRDLRMLSEAGIDAALIENDADSPCQLIGKPDVLAPMAVVAYELAKISKIPLGIQVLLNDPKASIAIAKSCGLQFIRADYFADEMIRQPYGKMKVNPHEILEYRSKIKAEKVMIFADVQVKYADLVKEKSLQESAIDALSCGADAIIVTGRETGDRPLTSHLQEAYNAIKNRVPVFVGSGFSKDNSHELLKYSDGAIVGSSIKTGEYIDVEKTRDLMRQVKGYN